MPPQWSRANHHSAIAMIARDTATATPVIRARTPPAYHRGGAARCGGAIISAADPSVRRAVDRGRRCGADRGVARRCALEVEHVEQVVGVAVAPGEVLADRKSTRLNSSHGYI